MKKLAFYVSIIALALLLAFGGSVGSTSVAFAQEATPVAEVSTQQQTDDEADDDDFPWGLLGLLGLAGLAGLRRRPEPVRRETTTPGVYDNPKR